MKPKMPLLVSDPSVRSLLSSKSRNHLGFRKQNQRGMKGAFAGGGHLMPLMYPDKFFCLRETSGEKYVGFV